MAGLRRQWRENTRPRQNKVGKARM